ncbi:MAG: biotin--[acetyl-CoA-carboxylase] ligase [Chthoniobacterales bacterium]
MEKRALIAEEFQKQSLWKGKIHFFETVTSTNDLLLELAEQGVSEGTIVIADRQTGGRGQFHRPWSSPQGMGLWMSLLLRLPIETEIMRPLSQLGPVSLCDAFMKMGMSISSLQIKPPNDLLIAGKKVAGVLVETRRGSAPFAVVGIGLNITQSLEDFPPELREKATSLALAGFNNVDRNQLVSILIQCFYERYQEFQFDPQKLHEAWDAACCCAAVEVKS